MNIPTLERSISIGTEEVRPHIGTDNPSFSPVRKLSRVTINHMIAIIKKAKEIEAEYEPNKTNS